MVDVLEIQLCGAPQFSWNGVAPIHLPGGKSLALLIYLVATRQPHARDQLANLLWSEMANQRARDNLRYVLPDLRKQLADYLLISAQTVQFNGTLPYQLDIETVRATLTQRPATLTTQALEAALDRCHDSFLAGFYVRNAPVFEEWVTLQRAELETLVLQGLQILAERYLIQGETIAGLTTTHRLLALNPLHEGGHRLQMQFLAASGQRGAAIEHFHQMRQRLQEEVGIDPTEETYCLYNQLIEIETTTDAAIKSTYVPIPSAIHLPTAAFTIDVKPERKQNLPGQLTPFLGRRSEIAELRSLLLGPNQRLVTIAGEGGIGKTRMALAVAQTIVASTSPQPGTSVSARFRGQTVSSSFPDGVWFIELHEFKTGTDLADLLVSAVAQSLGLQFIDNRLLSAQLVAQLRNKRLLLIFDNAEHLLPQITEFFIELLRHCQHLTLLVTSRHVLNLQAEFVWRLAGLAIPPAANLNKLTTAQIAVYSSVALFIERARRVQRDFQITVENREAVVAICRLVEGLPLAIELAAALINQHSCSELATTLQDDYKLLATTFADLPSRHRSIQAVLNYSWRFLTPDEAYALTICSVFSGGFDGAASATVVGATPTLLTKLTDQSLVQVHEGRFFMHELVRKFAADQLAQRPSMYRMALANHAAYFMDLLQGLEAALPVEHEAHKTIQRELGNIRAAWRWIVAEGDPALLAPGAATLQFYYRLTGLYYEAIQFLTAAIAAVRRAAATDSLLRLQAQLLCYLAQFHRRTGALEMGSQVATEALELGQQLAALSVQGLAYHELARLAQMRGKYAQMCVLAKEGATIARSANLSYIAAECFNDLGVAVSAVGDPLAGIPHFQAALDQLEEVAHHYLRAFILTNLGRAYLASHDYQIARDFLHQALALQQHLHDRAGSVATLIHLCNLWIVLGKWAEAQQRYVEAHAILQSTPDPYWESRLHISSGYLHYFHGDLASAQSAFARAEKIAQNAGLAIQRQWALIGLGHTLTALENYDVAGNCYRQAIALENSMNGYYHTADAHAGLATLYFLQGKGADAMNEVEISLAHLAERGLITTAAPFAIYRRCLQVLQHYDTYRALEVLQTAYRQLQAIADTLNEDSLRQTFLEDVDANRSLITAAKNAGLTLQ